MYVLTAEGKKYLNSGLPEKKLVDLLDKPLPIPDAKKHMSDLSIALTWAKKNKWIKIEGGRLILIEKPARIPEQDALEKISKGDKVDHNILDTLIKRNLVEKERDDIIKIAEKQLSKQINTLTPELIKTGLWKKAKLKSYNIKATGRKLYPGKRQPYNQFLSAVRQKLIELGFKEMTGPIIETEFWNFDALYQAQDHPSRDWAQTYSLKTPTHGNLPNKKTVEQVRRAHEKGIAGSTGWGYKWDPKKASQLMPRAHGTACSARQLSKGIEIPGKYFAIRRCFRPDIIDATHGIEFNQAEGIVIDPSLTFKHMLGILKMFVMEMTGIDKIKFYPDYYPFVEP